MRCARCGRLPEGEAPKWAFHCVCDPCVSCPLRDRLQDDQGGCLEKHDCSAMADWRIAHDEGRLPASPPRPCVGCGEKDEDGMCEARWAGRACPRLLAWVDPVLMDAMVAVVRADKVVGRGSCSSIDECMEDSDLAGELALDGVSSSVAAVRWARKRERAFLERSLDCRWGDDDDWQLEAWGKFRKDDSENPV